MPSNIKKKQAGNQSSRQKKRQPFKQGGYMTSSSASNCSTANDQSFQANVPGFHSLMTHQWPPVAGVPGYSYPMSSMSAHTMHQNGAAPGFSAPSVPNARSSTLHQQQVHALHAQPQAVPAPWFAHDGSQAAFMPAWSHPTSTTSPIASTATTTSALSANSAAAEDAASTNATTTDITTTVPDPEPDLSSRFDSIVIPPSQTLQEPVFVNAEEQEAESSSSVYVPEPDPTTTWSYAPANTQPWSSSGIAPSCAPSWAAMSASDPSGVAVSSSTFQYNVQQPQQPQQQQHQGTHPPPHETHEPPQQQQSTHKSWASVANRYTAAPHRAPLKPTTASMMTSSNTAAEGTAQPSAASSSAAAATGASTRAESTAATVAGEEPWNNTLDVDVADLSTPWAVSPAWAPAWAPSGALDVEGSQQPPQHAWPLAPEPTLYKALVHEPTQHGTVASPARASEHSSPASSAEETPVVAVGVPPSDVLRQNTGPAANNANRQQFREHEQAAQQQQQQQQKKENKRNKPQAKHQHKESRETPSTGGGSSKGANGRGGTSSTSNVWGRPRKSASAAAATSFIRSNATPKAAATKASQQQSATAQADAAKPSKTPRAPLRAPPPRRSSQLQQQQQQQLVGKGKGKSTTPRRLRFGKARAQLITWEMKQLVKHDATAYNPKRAPPMPEGTRFFVIRSFGEDDVHKSVKYNIWTSTAVGNKILSQAFLEARSSPVYLFFSANRSSEFVGMAQMLSTCNQSKECGVWSHPRWKGEIKVRWHLIKDLPSRMFEHIKVKTRLPGGKTQVRPLGNVTDVTSVPYKHGCEVVNTMCAYHATSSIFDDFPAYDAAEKEQQQQRQQAKDNSNSSNSSEKQKRANNAGRRNGADPGSAGSAGSARTGRFNRERPQQQHYGKGYQGKSS